MPYKKPHLNKILVWLTQVLTCPVCDSHYAIEDTKIIEGRQEPKGEESSVVIHSDCKNCHSSVMFNVALLGQEIFSVGVMSDVTSREAVSLGQLPPISSDELIAFHNTLNQFDGNFEHLLGK